MSDDWTGIGCLDWHRLPGLAPPGLKLAAWTASDACDTDGCLLHSGYLQHKWNSVTQSDACGMVVTQSDACDIIGFLHRPRLSGLTWDVCDSVNAWVDIDCL